MVRLSHEHVLLIGDGERELHVALLQAAPGAQVTRVPTVFDGIAELSANEYTMVLAATEPIERRPESAVQTLRRLSGQGRLILFGHATLEPLSRKMLHFGADDYLVLPADATEIEHLLESPPMRLAPSLAPVPAPQPAKLEAPPSAMDIESVLSRLPLADMLLDALLHQPHDSLSAALLQLNGYLAPAMELRFRRGDQAAPALQKGTMALSHSVRMDGEERGTLDLLVPDEQDEAAARHGLARIAALFGKLASLQDRHGRLQKLAITDELTGVYNARYFRHFLTRILERARKMHFPVTLLLFDIDDFKKYNDQFGHGIGDEILKETAAVMKRCTREHDLVARIGGDEFAVVFWDKEGPRQPREPRSGVVSRPPQSPQQIFQRFKSLLASDEFTALGQKGQGVLGVSAGLAVYPYDAGDAATLIREADQALMQGAKKLSGKNSIYIVGKNEPTLLRE